SRMLSSFQRKCLLSVIRFCLRLIGIHAETPTTSPPAELDGLLCPSGMDVVRHGECRGYIIRQLIRRLSYAAQSKHFPFQSMTKRTSNIGISSLRIKFV
ncbi:hypothetical protein PENTCL1PPCAC_630, partial [Pristionchus entomophagus]